MLKKHKQLIIGFLLGALLFGVIPVGAVIQEYVLTKSRVRLVIDGEEFANQDLPVLYMAPGYNYLPAASFREICDKLGIEFEYVSATNEIQINTKKTSETINQELPRTPSVDEDVVIPTDEEYIVLINNIKYISKDGINEYLRKVNKDRFGRAQYFLGMGSLAERTEKFYTLDAGEMNILIESVPIKVVFNHEYPNHRMSFVEYDYWKDNILPLIK